MNAPVRVTFPIGVTAVTLLVPVVLAFPAIEQDALIDVAVDPFTEQLTPVPDIFTPVAPARLVPVRVTARFVAPRFPEVGEIEVRVGPCTVNALFRVAFPIPVATVTFLVEAVAPVVMTQDAVTVVAVGVPVIEHVTPPPLMVTPVAVARFVPVIVTATVVPRTPVVGVMPVTVGPFTVNVSVFEIPPGVVTEMFRLPVAAAFVSVQDALTVVAVTVPTVQLMPLMPVLTADVPNRLVPVRVIGKLVPRRPEVGEIELNVGAGGARTVKITLPVVPPGVVTFTVLAV